jgi:hypothetical protein
MLDIKITDDMISTKEAAEISGLTHGYLRNIRKSRDACDYIQINRSLVMYDRATFIAWDDERKRKKIAAIMGN